MGNSQPELVSRPVAASLWAVQQSDEDVALAGRFGPRT